jgi:hypothetical protein
MEPTDKVKIPAPPCRRLRHFAFDPTLSRRIETYDINEVVANLPWEDDLKIGPVDEYLEIVDYDPTSQAFYPPVDLNNHLLIAQDGLPSSDKNPQFHQQMVYAVARTTIGHFERALGRKALWAHHWNPQAKDNQNEFVQRLRAYPHAIREANAYYSPAKKALLFGYFPASAADSGDNYPGETVFTCLSQDIVAHETTHALLDGLHQRFMECSNIDVLAFHEAFADIVALFQHFTYPEVLRHQIARTRGNLQSQNLLGELAYQFGQAIGNYGALRSAIGKIDPNTKKWAAEEPDPQKINKTTEPHARGAILVAAVFDAFITVYNWRIAPLLRVATGGSGILPEGELHPDLVNLLAKEAAKTARHILQICIRALDYCVPVDITFGDYLRALITADRDMVTDDRHNYRLAFIQAFRQRGIIPWGVRNMSEENLLWEPPQDAKAFRKIITAEFLDEIIPKKPASQDRKKMFDQNQNNQKKVHIRLSDDPHAAEVARIVLDTNAPKTYYGMDHGLKPHFQVFSVRPARRIGPNGDTLTDLVIEIIQSRFGYFDPKTQEKADKGESTGSEKPDFVMRGGCTLLIDPQESEIRYCIFKTMSDGRMKNMREFLIGDESPSLRATYFGDMRKTYYRDLLKSKAANTGSQYEPFSFLHRSHATEEVE